MNAAEHIKNIISMKDVAERSWFVLDRSERILCPFHDDKKPSLKIYSEPGKGFYCFSCQSGGSVIDFIMMLYNLNFKDAIQKINADFNLNLNFEKPTRSQIRQQQMERRKRIYAKRNSDNQLNKLLAEHCRLWQDFKRGEPWTENWTHALQQLAVLEVQIEQITR